MLKILGVSLDRDLQYTHHCIAESGRTERPELAMKKYRGHYCRICHKIRPNEAFTGKGHRTHICEKCAALPKEEREEVEHKDEIFNYLRQSHISGKNVSRLQKLACSPNEQVAELAGIALEVAEIRPYKKKRLRELASKRRDLLQKLEETGLIFAHGY